MKKLKYNIAFIISGITIILSQMSCAQNSIYNPFKTDFDGLCRENAYFHDSFRLTDSLSKSLLRCEHMSTLINCSNKNQYYFIINSWNPITDSLEFFARFKLSLMKDYYEFGVDSLKVVDMAILNTNVSVSNADIYGYCAIISLMYTMDYKYMDMARDALINARPNSILVWYFDFLVSINVTTTRDWNNTELGVYKPFVKLREYKKK